MKSHGNHDRMGATGSSIRPGDFPLGSAESRAAARAKLQQVQKMTPYDRDCLSIYNMMYAVPYAHSPNSSDIKDTDVYKRGHELSAALDPVVPMYLDPFYQQERRYSRCQEAYLYFHVLYRRLPISGDVLHREVIETTWGVEEVAEHIGKFRAAWRRQFPQFPCPWKFEDGKEWLRSAESKPGHEVWRQYNGPGTAPEIWSRIEAEAQGSEYSPREENTTVSAVVDTARC